MDDLRHIKLAARKAAAIVRDKAHSSKSTQLGAANLSEFLLPRNDSMTAGYLAISSEIDPALTMANLARNNGVGVPEVTGHAQALAFLRWRSGAEMQPGAFGVLVPVDRYLVEPVTLIIPLLAYDSRGFRLGYGGGFYDRTLEKLRATRPVFAVGFAYSAQQVDAVPTEATDQPLDVIVTEAGKLIVN